MSRRLRRHARLLAVALPGVGLAATAADARPALPDGARTAGDTAARPSQQAYDEGKGLLALDDVPRALAAFEMALSHDPQSVAALNAIGVCYDRLGRPDLARTAWDAALAIDPDAADVLGNIGLSLHRQGQSAEAIPFLRRAVAAGDDRARAAAQRTLALVADALVREAATPRPAATVAEAAPSRIVMAANGEAELVMGAAPPALAATLGDAAALTVPATAAGTRPLPTPTVTATVVAGAAVTAAADGGYDLVLPPAELALADVTVVTPGYAPVAASQPLAPPLPARSAADALAARLAPTRRDLSGLGVAAPAAVASAKAAVAMASTDAMLAAARDPAASHLDPLAQRLAELLAPGRASTRPGRTPAPAVDGRQDNAALPLDAADPAERERAIARLRALVAHARALKG